MKKIKILDLSTLVPGPFATYLLSIHLSVDIIKIEDINQPDPLANMRPSKNGIGLAYQTISASKKIKTIDFRKGTVEQLKSEIVTADIFIHNFKATRAFKLGVSYADISAINPKIIYCAISGYPASSPQAKKSAHDLNILAQSGYLHQQLQLSPQATLPPMLLADIFTSYHATIKLMAALISQTSGEVPVSMSEAFAESMTISTAGPFVPSDYLFSGNLPCYSLYLSQDKNWVAVAALETPLWVDLCDHLGRSDLVDKQFDPASKPLIAQEIAKYPSKYWLSPELDFCVTPIVAAHV